MELEKNPKGSTIMETVQLVTETKSGDQNPKGSTRIAVGATYG
jgi:hypothetical protein